MAIDNQMMLGDDANIASTQIFDHSGYIVTAISPQDANKIVIENHYLHRRPSNSYAFGLLADTGRIDGVVVFGIPASRHVQMSACPTEPSRVIELCRLWIRDELGKNAESYLVSRALKSLPPLVVISYADTAHGHVGTIYRALGFDYAGWTDMDRRSARVDYEMTDNKHPRDAFRNGNKPPSSSLKKDRSTKARYWTVTGNKRERHALRKIVNWASISWKDYPVPTKHTYCKIDPVGAYTTED